VSDRSRCIAAAQALLWAGLTIPRMFGGNDPKFPQPGGQKTEHPRASAVYPEAMEDPARSSISERLSSAASAAELERLLLDVFVSERDATYWWTAPHPMLEGAAPRDVATGPDGVEKVRRVLVGMSHGFPV
jgi:hypothetical protein